MSKTLEQKIEINGAIGSSFLDAFRKANQGMSDFQKEAKAIQRELNRLNNDFRSGRLHESQYIDETQKLGTELNSLERELKDAAAAQKRFADETALAKRRLDEQAAAAKKRNATLKSDLQAGVSNAYGKVKTGATIAAVGTTALATATAIDSINTAAEFEADMAKVASKVSATNLEMKALKDTAIELGAATSLSASETALGMDELAAKGMNANEIIAAMPGIIAGAEASGEDLTLVSDVVTSAINAYGLQAQEASRIADVMAMSAIKSAAGVQDLGYSFKYAAPIAKTLGVELEELAASTGLLVDGGLAGEQAGTALRMAMTRLSAPPTDAQKALKKLNISVVDSEDKFKSLAEITEDWNKATKNLTDTQKVQYASTIFGTEASTAMLSLFSNGADEIRNMTKALKESEGAAADVAANMKNNFAGAKEQLSGAFDSAKIKFASPILPVLQDTMVGITSLIENNLDNIETAGEKVATALSQITAPFSMTEPVKPVITPEMDPSDVQSALAKYQEDLRKYELFAPMDVSDKVHYMLDQTIDHVSEWVQGDGGEKMQELFAELASIAAGAWSSSFTTMLKGSMSELAEGDIGSAVAMGAAANAMTGGLLLSGGLAGGKWLAGKGVDKWKDSRTAKADKAASSAVATATTPVDAAKGKGKAIAQAPTAAPQPAQLAQRPNAKPPTTAVAQPTPTAATSAVAQSGKGFGKHILKGAGRVALPVAAAAGVIEIVTSDNKAEATGKTVGGLAGGLGGAKIGALIGTAIAPGIGTAIGGALGGIVGGIGGSSLGSKAGNAIAGPTPQNNTAVAQQPPPNVAAANAQLETNILALSTQYQTETVNLQLSFTTLQTETTNLSTSLMNLTTQIGEATGWITTLQQIQPAAQRVVTALNVLEQRINAIELPGAPARRTAYE